MRKLLLVLAIIALICVSSIEAAKKGKKKKSEKPTNVEPRLYCESCRALVNETLKMLKGSTSEIEIYDILSDPCNQRRYVIYEHIPPDIEKGCNAFLAAGHDELFIKLLLNRKNDDGLVEELCWTRTGACKDLPTTKKEPTLDVSINGVPQSYKIETAKEPTKKDSPTSEDL